MASTPTVGKQPTTVRLKYNPNDGTVTSTPSKPTFQKDERVQFVSDNGGDVYVQLNSHAYKPNVFRPGAPVTVTKDPLGKESPAHCGFVIEVNGKKVGYGWLPADVKSTLPPPDPYNPRVLNPAVVGFETDP